MQNNQTDYKKKKKLEKRKRQRRRKSWLLSAPLKLKFANEKKPKKK